ncbi:DUF4190 domain-containing protein [Isoptericola sp. F-RaC21]|uniref:DUF4190 domain-containing protein n=1 Tax=Isoptericola sp. F-RaC21 TaxID=3141452 RepID=UPI00315C174D
MTDQPNSSGHPGPAADVDSQSPAQQPYPGGPGYPQQPMYAQPGMMPQPIPRRGNAMAITGFVIAVVALLLCFIPIINNFAFFLALVGLVFGIIGLVKTRKGAAHKGIAIAGVILSVLSGAGVLVSQTIYGNALDSLSDDLEASASDPLAGADSASDSDGSADSVDDAEAGTRANPYAFSQKVSNDDWTVKLGKPHEATDKVLAENPYNEKPGKGMEYWMVPVSATYTGSETGLPMMDITVRFVGDDAKTYSDRCGVIPNDLADEGELYEGGHVDGNVCVAVPQGADGEWTLTAGIFNDPVFFRTEG